MGIFGGTFDPIHYGHLRTAFELLETLRLPEMRFMPAGNPPHREHTVASNALRLDMVRAATAGQPGFTVDDREMHKSGPSYSVETLAELRSEFPTRPLCLIVGNVGFVKVEPGAPNVIPGRAEFPVELRDLDDAKVVRMKAAITCFRFSISGRPPLSASVFTPKLVCRAV